MIPLGEAKVEAHSLRSLRFFNFTAYTRQLGADGDAVKLKKPFVLCTKGFDLRRERDSNPRYLAVYTLSKRARSATLTPLRLFYLI